MRTVSVAGVEVGRGSRVVLRPGGSADVFDRAVAGRVAMVDGLHETMEGQVQLTVLVEDDPGIDMGRKRQPGHRFFFSPDEVEPIDSAPPTLSVLVAGIGNVFMGDDGFGVEVAGRLAERRLPRGVTVADFGIRGLDLVYALGEGWDVAVFVDAVPYGREPGEVFVLEPDLSAATSEEPVALDAHGMDPVKVLALAAQLGTAPDRVLVVGCQPQVQMTGDEEEIIGELSEPVRAAVDEAVELVEQLIAELVTEGGGR